MNKYITPDFDVTVYDIEDVITLSSGDGTIDGGNVENAVGGWWGE